MVGIVLAACCAGGYIWRAGGSAGADAASLPAMTSAHGAPAPFGLRTSPPSASAKRRPGSPAPGGGPTDAAAPAASAIPTAPPAHEPRTLSSIANPRTFGPGTIADLDPLARSRAALAAGEILAARGVLAAALGLDAGDPLQRQLRDELGRISQETLFSRTLLDGDELVARYRVARNDTLASIASRFRITADLISQINDLPSKDRIAVGRSLKVVNGPFRVRVKKSAFVLDVLLGDTLVCSLGCGLGKNGSTPTGRWIVRDKLPNPAWTDPRNGEHYRPDDPDNPIGEYWLALEGVEGNAVGKRGFGIHGTIEPESIGHEMSLGCVRLLPADIEFLYRLLVRDHSTVDIVD